MNKTTTKKSLWGSAAIITMILILLLGSMTAAVSAKADKGPNLVQKAIELNSTGPTAGQFDTLISAVVNLDLVDTLSANRPYTVFAPTDAAFAAAGLDAGSFIGLSEEDKATYTDIVLYHVTRGVRSSQSIVNTNKVKMLNGDFAYVDGVSIDGAPIVAPDAARVSNGVIHVVGAVLFPPM